MTTTAKNIMVELNKGEKLNGDNYEILSMKIQYVLEEKEALEVLKMSILEPKQGNTAQHRRDCVAYETLERKTSTTRIMLLSNIDDGIMREFRKYEITKDMWYVLSKRFGGTSISKLRSLTIKFDTYKKCPKHNMKKHLRQMSNIISELKDAGHTLIDEQQVQAVICSLPQIREHMKMYLTHNENIKTLEDAMHHLELEEDRLMASKKSTDVYIASSSSHGRKWHKSKFHGGN